MESSGPRRRWMREAALLAMLYAAYTGVRLSIAGDPSAAFANAGRIMEWERLLGLDVERAANVYVSARPALAVPLCLGYAALHDVMTIGVLAWLWRGRPRAYPAARAALLATTALALLGFWLFPLAPPRMLPGFVDTMPAYAEYGWWGSGPGDGPPTNEFAAMPSLHAAWALWCGLQLWRNGGRAARALAIGYPAAVIVIVVGTANHFVLDAVAGAGVLAAGLALSRAGGRLVQRLRQMRDVVVDDRARPALPAVPPAD